MRKLGALIAPVKQPLVFAIIGLACLGLQMVYTEGIVAFLHLPAWFANVVAFLLSAVCNYVLQRRFTFKRINKSWLAGLAGFLGAATVALAVNEAAFLLFHDRLLWGLFWTQFVAGICSTGVSFTLNKFVFLKPKPQTVEA